ncbi:hypothetical protein SK069_02695 [Patulibacter brassicae]|uniref:DUF3352 domain-containing protein n=1 Tax=Patulibacter brassicae TaxID=1705717 RepID=A0ABU4VFB0_9ACTN|nr:hypothetical protein [Patulibacter brassicae]MDX8150489.1 hypothetical protein [Patulibacter brassicae]
MTSRRRAFALPRRRWRVLGLVAVVAVALVLVRAGEGGDPGPPPQSALALVPRDALVVLHASTDRDRPPVAAARRLAERFAAWPGLRERIREGLVPRGCPPLEGIGDEVALALVPDGAGRASTLALVEVGARDAGPPLRRCGGQQVRRLGRFLAIGRPGVVRAARALHERRPGARSFARQPLVRDLTEGLPRDRVLDAWVTRDGLRRVLVPRGGLAATVAALVDRPGLAGAAVAVAPGDGGARIVVRTRGAAPGRASFTPASTTSAPAGALASLRTVDPLGDLRRILAAAGERDAQALLRRATTATARLVADGSSRLRRDLVDAVRGSSELVLLPGGRGLSAAMAVVVPVTDGARARAALRSLHDRVPAIAGRRLRRTTVAGRSAWTLEWRDGVRLGYLVVGNRVILFTRPGAAREVLRPRRRLSAVDGFGRTTATGGKPVMSIGFLDFQRLLRVVGAPGLADRPAYAAVEGDLAAIRAVGMVSRASGGDTTASIDLWIP